MEDKKKVILIGIGIIVLLAVAAGIYYLSVIRRKSPQRDKPLQAPPPPAAEGTAPDLRPWKP